MRTTHCLLILFSLAAGCGKNPYFSDDEGAERPAASRFGDHPDELSLPYALGTQVNIAVKQFEATGGAATVRSDAPAVLRVDKVTADSSGQISAACTAVGEGETTLHLVDGQGAVQRSAVVSVRAPDAARLYAHGPIRVLEQQRDALPSAEVQEVRVLAGGQAVFAVAYLAGDTRLYGRGIASVEAAPTVAVMDVTSSGNAINEWLIVSPSAPGDSSLTVRAGGRTLATLPMASVAEGDLAALSLVEEQGDKSQDKQQVWVFAKATDAMGRPVHGVYASWTLDGASQMNKDDPQRSNGELYRYEWDATGNERVLAATHGGLNVSTPISAHEGWVSDTTYLGCSAGGRPGRPAALLSLSLLVGALLLRRTRRVR